MEARYTSPLHHIPKQIQDVSRDLYLVEDRSRSLETPLRGHTKVVAFLKIQHLRETLDMPVVRYITNGKASFRDCDVALCFAHGVVLHI